MRRWDLNKLFTLKDSSMEYQKDFIEYLIVNDKVTSRASNEILNRCGHELSTNNYKEFVCSILNETDFLKHDYDRIRISIISYNNNLIDLESLFKVLTNVSYPELNEVPKEVSTQIESLKLVREDLEEGHESIFPTNEVLDILSSLPISFEEIEI